MEDSAGRLVVYITEGVRGFESSSFPLSIIRQCLELQLPLPLLVRPETLLVFVPKVLNTTSSTSNQLVIRVVPIRIGKRGTAVPTWMCPMTRLKT